MRTGPERSGDGGRRCAEDGSELWRAPKRDAEIRLIVGPGDGTPTLIAVRR